MGLLFPVRICRKSPICFEDRWTGFASTNHFTPSEHGGVASGQEIVDVHLDVVVMRFVPLGLGEVFPDRSKGLVLGADRELSSQRLVHEVHFHRGVLPVDGVLTSS